MSVLSRPCPFCGSLYGEHSLDALASCVEESMGPSVHPVYEEPADTSTPAHLTWRRVEPQRASV